MKEAAPRKKGCGREESYVSCMKRASGDPLARRPHQASFWGFLGQAMEGGLESGVPGQGKNSEEKRRGKDKGLYQ